LHLTEFSIHNHERKIRDEEINLTEEKGYIVGVSYVEATIF
jgi:hypothetical protein